MSAVPVQTLPRPPSRRAGGGSGPSAPARPRRRPRRKPRIAYAIIALGAIILVAAAQLVLSVAMTQGAYELDSLRVQQTKLERDRQIVGEELDALQSPQNLARNAEELGMVPNTTPVYLRLSDGGRAGTAAGRRGRCCGVGAARPDSLIADVPLVNQPLAGDNASGGAVTEPPSDADQPIVPPGRCPLPTRLIRLGAFDA
ncbi:hypothetical protein ACFOE1_18510 [Agromyces mediolanus]|uniref:hypothetical protein n=1 Tax=Agromyces mediolanus TaxID=41986 RepID=UPI00360D4961